MAPAIKAACGFVFVLILIGLFTTLRKGSSDPTKSATIEHSLTSLCHLRSLAEQFIVVTSVSTCTSRTLRCLLCSMCEVRQVGAYVGKIIQLNFLLFQFRRRSEMGLSRIRSSVTECYKRHCAAQTAVLSRCHFLPACCGRRVDIETNCAHTDGRT